MDEGLILKKTNGIPIYQFPNLTVFKDIEHGIFTRHGGCSAGAFQSLNVSYNIGDDAPNVHKNRALVAECMREGDLVSVNQVHGTDVFVVGRVGTPAGDAGEPNNPPTADALITSVPGKALLIQVADCQPVLIYDPVKKVIANVHSGWRGSISNIIGRTVAVMGETFGCSPSDMVAGIGPSLGPCCAEFIHYRTEIPARFWKYKNASNFFDFWAISRDQLRDAGLPDKNIAVSGFCTRCNTDRFFSYRREHITGRFAGVIVLKPPSHPLL